MGTSFISVFLPLFLEIYSVIKNLPIQEANNFKIIFPNIIFYSIMNHIERRGDGI